ncbi:glutamyl-tRNA reductase [Bordetella pertussis]|nr:glutamyl-tRNA reductase [Bordetella pertussis]
MLARGESPEAVLEQLAHGLTQKYLHGPLAPLAARARPRLRGGRSCAGRPLVSILS